MKAIDPTTGDVIEQFTNDSRQAVDMTLQAAHDCYESWRNTTFDERAERLRALHDLFMRDRDALATLMAREMGKAVNEGRSEVEKSAGACTYYADNGAKFATPIHIATDAESSYVTAEPLGPLLAVMPWNFPVWQVVRAAAPALMAGNVVLLKHASNVPGCARAITALFEEAGFGKAFQNLAVGSDMIDEVIGDDRIAAVTVTGSVRAGRAVAKRAGEVLKPTVLELGGSDAFVVLDDADLDQAVEGAISGRFLNAGQSCISAKRMIVDDAIHDAFVTRLKTAVEALKWGDPQEEETDVGPMARSDLRDELHANVEASVRAGARAVVGGEPCEGRGWFYPPTLLTQVTPGMPAFDEELFGPVAVVIRADDEADAIRLANGTRFGLGGSVWSGDTARGVRVAQALVCGHASVNGIVKSDARLPFGGVRDSGYGRELSREGFLAFTNRKTYWVGRPADE